MEPFGLLWKLLTTLQCFLLSRDIRFLSHFLHKLHCVAQKLFISLTMKVPEPAFGEILALMHPEIVPCLQHDSLFDFSTYSHYVYLIFLLLYISLELHHQGYFVNIGVGVAYP